MKVGLIGTFDVENFGDCMFPELYTHLLNEHFGEVDVTLYSPLSTAARILSFEDVEALPDSEDSKALEVFDVDNLILIGGETIGYGHSPGTFNFPRQTLSAYLRLWLSPILAVNDNDLRPSFFAAQSVGAVKMSSEVNRIVARCLSSADRIRFRDNFSADWIKTEERKFQVDIDPMFLLDELCSERGWTARAQKYLPTGFELNNYLAAQVSIGYGENDLEAWVRAVADISRQNNTPVLLLPICHFLEDERLLEKLADMLQSEGITTHLVRGLLNVKDTAALIGMSQGYIGSSLHGAVTAVSFGIPLAVLGHTPDGKHAGTLKSVGVEGVVATQNKDLPECFQKSLSIDRDKARANAHVLARSSVEALFDAIRTGQSEASENDLSVATQLIELERAPNIKSDVKRLVLRIVRQTPIVSAFYRWWRTYKVFRLV